jgi:hypothetical protein
MGSHRILQPAIVIGIGLLLGACTYQQSLRHPTLPPLVPIDRTMDCGQIDLSIDRADTVRWLIRDDGGRLETSGHKAARYAGNAVLIPISLISYFPTYIDDGGHTVLNAADGRIRELLQLKRDRGCPARVTALSGMDDLTLLAELETVQGQLDAGQGEQGELFRQRMTLLDSLRVVLPLGPTTP